MSSRGRPRKERYARLMGGFWRNDKVRRLSLEARGLLATAWSYSADQKTDGRIPVELLRAWSGSRFTRLTKELAGFLEVSKGEIDAIAHDWIDHNIASDEWERKLALERSRKRKRGDIPPGNTPGFPPGKSPGNGTGIPPNFRGGALDEDEDEFKPSPDGEGSSRSPPASRDHFAESGVLARIQELSQRYPPELVQAAHDGCALSRRNGRMAPRLWLTTLERLAKLPEHAAVRAMEVFVDKHADGDKAEKYLLAIARGEAKRKRSNGFAVPDQIDPEEARRDYERALELFAVEEPRAANG